MMTLVSRISVAALGTDGAEQTDQPHGLEPLAVFCAEDQAEIRQDDQQEPVEKLDALVGEIGPEQASLDGARDREPADEADERADQPRRRGLAERAFEGHDEAGEHETEEDDWREDLPSQTAEGAPQHMRRRRRTRRVRAQTKPCEDPRYDMRRPRYD